MSTVRKQKPKIFVKIPFGYGVYKFKLIKSTNWGAVDHLLIQHLVGAPQSPQSLSDSSGLPSQVIIEILTPLMQAGWVEIINLNGQYLFKLTRRGLMISQNEELPASQEPIISVRSFVVDPITNQCYRVDKRRKKQAFQLLSRTKSEEIFSQYGNYATEVRIKNATYSPKLSAVYSCIANDNEEVFGIEDAITKLSYGGSVRFSIVHVDQDDEIFGVPEISQELRDAIIHAANAQREKISSPVDSKDGKPSISHFEFDPRNTSYRPHKIHTSKIKILSTPEEHYNCFIDAIRNTRSRLVIHSTFINLSCLESIYEELVQSALKGVRIDILWGQTEPDEEKKLENYKLTAAALAEMQETIERIGLGTQIQLHTTPTNSHSKFIIHDDDRGNWVGVVGSCNWLSSNFNRFEASIRIQSPTFASELLSIASNLAMGGQGLATPLSRELAIYSAKLAKVKQSEPTSKLDIATFRILPAAEHHSLAKQACFEAQKEIFVCSHRVSYAGERPILTPLSSAKSHTQSLAVRVAYGRPSGAMKNPDAERLFLSLKNQGFTVEKADDPQIHAKFIVWDDKNLIISSLNWLSASSQGEEYGELGVHINGGDYAGQLTKSFQDFYRSRNAS